MSAKNAIKAMLGLLTVVMLFHLSIMLKVIPYDIAWGGRLKNDTEMYVFETISLSVNLFLFLILLIKGNYIKSFISMRAVNLILWIFIMLFGLNTIGNFLAETNFEKFFAILTLASALLIWITLREGKKRTPTRVDGQ